MCGSVSPIHRSTDLLRLTPYIAYYHNNQLPDYAAPDCLVLVPDWRSEHKYDTVTSARSAKIAKHQMRNKIVEVVKNVTVDKCEVSPATNDINVVQIPKIYIAVETNRGHAI